MVAVYLALQEDAKKNIGKEKKGKLSEHLIEQYKNMLLEGQRSRTLDLEIRRRNPGILFNLN